MKSLPSVPYRRVVVETVSCHREKISCSSERDIWGKWPESSEIVKRSAKLLAAHFSSVLASPGTVGHYGLRRAQWFSLQWIARTIVWPYWNHAVGGRQYQCSHFLILLCNNYCRHKTETALHYSHNLPFLVLRMSIRVQHSYNLWTRLEFGPRKKWIFKIYKKKIQP